MDQTSFSAVIRDQTARALWEVKNVIDCIPDESWDKPLYGVPLWKHVYHMLHSLDLWFIGSLDFQEPDIHVPDLNNLDYMPTKTLSREEVHHYYSDINTKINNYVNGLRDEILLERPEGNEYTKFTLILAQFRHLHTHMGMLMCVAVIETGRWPKIIGLQGTIPEAEYDRFE